MNVEQDIIDWLCKQPNWQQEAVSRLLSKQELEESDIKELTEFCKTKDGQAISNHRCFPEINISKNSGKELHIKSIGPVHGIENLNTNQPLDFGDSNLVVVFGGNGCGKSSYVRILKKACGKADILRTNVFEKNPKELFVILYIVLMEPKPKRTGFLMMVKSAIYLK